MSMDVELIPVKWISELVDGSLVCDLIEEGVSVEIGSLGQMNVYQTDMVLVCSGSVSALRAICVNGSGIGVYADAGSLSTSLVVGISITAGTTVNVRTSGVVEDPAWSWTPNAPVYLGANGYMTQTQPTSGILAVIGTAKSENELLVNIQPPIVRA